MKKLFRHLNRVWGSGVKKSMRMLHIFIPLSLFFTLILTVGSSIIFSYGLVSNFVDDLNSKLNIVVYFDPKVGQNYIDEVVSKINERPDVLQVEYISREQALESFKQRHADDNQTLEALEETGTNPFGPSLVVFSKDPSNYKTIASEIESMNDQYQEESIAPVEDVSYENHKIAIDKFGNMLRKGEVIFGALIIIMMFILTFVTYISLRFATQGDRDEIKIMKLVGASNSLILGPTAIMGMLAGLVGAILSLIILYFLAINITPYTNAFSGFNMLGWYSDNIQLFIMGNIIVGMFIGFIGSILAVRRHL